MDKLDWCLKQNKGIKLVESNSRISEDYMQKALEDKDMIEKVNKIRGMVDDG